MLTRQAQPAPRRRASNSLSSVAAGFEPIENGIQAARQAREGLIAGGDLANAGYAYHPIVTFLLDCAPTLDSCVAEAEAGLAFAAYRQRRERPVARPLRWLADVLRGESAASGRARRSSIDANAGNPQALVQAPRIDHAVAAAIFGDPVDLARHTEAAMPLLQALVGRLTRPPSARLARGLALAGQARDQPR